MNIDNIKNEFPIFNNKVHNNDLVYLDSANSAQKPKVVVDRIYDLYSKFYNQQNTFQKADYPIVPKPEFVKTFNTQTNNFKASKYMCMLFLETFYKGTPKQRNKVVTEMIRYAASNTDQSSYFIKVS